MVSPIHKIEKPRWHGHALLGGSRPRVPRLGLEAFLTNASFVSAVQVRLRWMTASRTTNGPAEAKVDKFLV
jgi:hypothetical protein